MENSKTLRVVCLFGTGTIFDKTLSELLDAGVNVVGVCNANKHQKGVDFSYLKIAVKKYGYWSVFLQILGKILYKLKNGKQDRKIYNKLYDTDKIKKSLEKFSGEYHVTDNYQSPETLEWIKSKSPDLLLVHTGYWVGKKVRNLVKGRCLGGHPGITPKYRGVHSPFWAMYNGEPDKIGYSVFWVDGGVDTGDVLYQSSIPIDKGDSFYTMSWKGMIGIAQNQARLIKEMEMGVEPKRKVSIIVDERTNYTHPTIFQYLKYKRIQKLLR